MKQISFSKILMLSILLIGLTGCKKDTAYTCTTCKTTPDALAANDNSSKGVYKGVVIGSTGTIMFDILNSGNTITATLVIDGVQTVLTSNVQWTGNTAYVGNFTGTMNGSPVSIKLSIDMDGSNPVITSADIPGHPNAVFDIVKETSKNLVECFEGTYSTTKPETGTFNLLLTRTGKLFGGIARKDGSTETNDFGGTIDASNNLVGDNGKVMGTLSGDVISGSFKDDNNSTVTISANRKW